MRICKHTDMTKLIGSLLLFFVAKAPEFTEIYYCYNFIFFRVIPGQLTTVDNESLILAALTRYWLGILSFEVTRTYIFHASFVVNEGESVNMSHGSKTAVIGFLCVSLGSSTVQLHDSLGSSSS
jgi:hypothetical protein